MQGTIFSIEEFSIYDGPGIRTTVFLKGCPLRCSWCHNPEGQSAQTEIIRSPNGCIGCGNCVRSSVKENGRFYFTEESIKKCPMNLLRVCGETIESHELCDRLLKNAIILNNGGGITFSGGEPLEQSDFVFECLKYLKGKVHTAIQTSGYCSSEKFSEALELSDYFLYDLKIINTDKHKKYTGVSNEKILENFNALSRSKKDFTVRVPLIPEVTDTEENIEDICAVLNKSNVSYVELLPYNKMAGGKYKMLQRTYEPDFNEKAEVNPHEEIFKKFGIKTKIL